MRNNHSQENILLSVSIQKAFWRGQEKDYDGICDGIFNVFQSKYSVISIDFVINSSSCIPPGKIYNHLLLQMVFIISSSLKIDQFQLLHKTLTQIIGQVTVLILPSAKGL